MLRGEAAVYKLTHIGEHGLQLNEYDLLVRYCAQLHIQHESTLCDTKALQRFKGTLSEQVDHDHIEYGPTGSTINVEKERCGAYIELAESTQKNTQLRIARCTH